MPVYTIETPTGAKLDIEAANEQAAIAGAQQWHQQNASGPSATDYAKDAVQSIPHGMMQRLSQMLSASGNAADLEMSGGQANPDNPTPEQAQSALEQNVTGATHTPTTGAGKIAAAAAGSLIDPTSYLGPGSLPLKMLSAAGAGAGSEAAGQATEGTPWETPARLAGGVLGGSPAMLLDRPPTVQPIPAPSRAALEVGAGADYGLGRAAPDAIHPQVVQATSQRARAELSSRTLGPEQAPLANALLDRIDQSMANGPLDMTGLDSIRKSINTVGEAGGYESTAANVLRGHVNDMMDNLPAQRAYTTMPSGPLAGQRVGQSPMTAGTEQGAMSAMDSFRAGDGNFAAAGRSEMLADAIDHAQLRTAVEHSGQNGENKLRQAAAKILTSDTLSRGLGQDHLAALRELAEGSMASNLNRQIANRLGGGGGMGATLMSILGSGVAGLPGAIVGGLGGTALRSVGARNTLARIQAIEASLRMASPMGRAIVQPVQQRLPSSVIAATLLRSLKNGAQTQ